MDTSTLPPLDLVGPDGDRLVVRALGRDDTVGTLAHRLGVETLSTPCGVLASDHRLTDVDEMRIGVRVSGPSERTVAPVDGRPLVEVAVVAGPSSTSWQSLPAGRHFVGRAPHARIRLDDAAIEPYHALLRIEEDGCIEMIQLTGAVPLRVDGRALESIDIDTDTRLSIGASVIRIRPLCSGVIPSEQQPSDVAGPAVGSMAVHPNDPWRRVVRRAPHDPVRWSAAPITAPVSPVEPQRPSLTGLIGTGVTATGAVVIATVMGNPLFMLFAAMGAIAALVTFATGVVGARRKRSKLRLRHADEMADFAAAVDALHDARRAHHRDVHRTVAETLDEILGGGTRVWQRHRRGPGGDAGLATQPGESALSSVVIGWGTHRWQPAISVPDRGALDSTLIRTIERCACLDGVAAPLSIRPGDAVAFHGPRRHSCSIVRSVIAQLATWVGPADWQLVVVSADHEAWSWVDWLPHGALGNGALIRLDPGTGDRRHGDLSGDALDSIDPSRPTLLVTDEPALFAARTGPLRRFVSATDASSLVVVDTDTTVPALCRRVLTVGSTGSASWSGDVVDSDDAVSIAFAGVSIETADRVARRLACLVDPEDDGGSGGGVPGAVSFAELMPDTSCDAIVRRWQDGGPDPAPAGPLGMSVDGRVDIDLVRDGPHGLIAGTTGSGKSELLRTLVLGLAASVGPQHLNFVLVDYKGGSTFDACVALPHTVGLVTDLDDGLAERALVSLDAELHRRERILRSVGAADLTDYRSRRSGEAGPLEAIARLVVVIDEFAALAKELPDFLAALVGIAQRGRSLGVHLLLATQRPAGVVNDDIRANTNLRLALRLHDRPDAVDVVGDELPAKFPRGLPGRAALRLGPDELVVFQAARCTGPAPTADGGGIVVDRPGGPIPCVEIEMEPDLTELDRTVAVIVDAAERLGVAAPHRPWVEALPFPLPAHEVAIGTDADATAAIGCIDDPEHQRRQPLVWRPGDGSLALVGSIGSGTTSTLIAIASSVCGRAGPDDLHLYVVDGRGDDGLTALASIAHCGGVVRLTEDERLHRLLMRVVDAIDRRQGIGGVDGSEPDIVVMIDGYGSLRASLAAIERQATFDLLHRVVNDGPAVGIAIVVADDGGTAVTMIPVAHRWVFHVDDPGVARGLGVRGPLVGPGRPGRLRIAGSGLEAQVAQGAPGLAALPARADACTSGPRPVAILAEHVSGADLDELAAGAGGMAVRRSRDGASLAVGVASDDLGPATIEIVDGDHLLVIGGPRTGVSTALDRVARAWESDASIRGSAFRFLRVDRRTPLDPDALSAVVEATDVRVAIVVDNAHRVDDPGVLAEIAKGEHPHVTILAGARADAVRTGYGHWTREVARSRCGIVLASRSDPDGDVLSVQIPRRPLVAARPGLAWIVDGGPLRQVQVASP